MIDLWELENEYYDSGVSLLCGVDEAGRGPLAGPVCAAAVILPRGLEIPGLNDSKKLSEKRRDALFDSTGVAKGQERVSAHLPPRGPWPSPGASNATVPGAHRAHFCSSALGWIYSTPPLSPRPWGSWLPVCFGQEHLLGRCGLPTAT